MNHEYDDPIGDEQLMDARCRAAGRYRAADCDLHGLVTRIVAECFCSCVTSPLDARATSGHAGVVDEICRGVRLILASGQLIDGIDEALVEAFPASAPPAWIWGG